MAATGNGEAAEPSFNCENARGPVEKLICQDDELAALDISLARRFAASLSRAPADQVKALKDAQIQWRRSRNDCGKVSDTRRCTLEAYSAALGQ